jgi:hypothetical protein
MNIVERSRRNLHPSLFKDAAREVIEIPHQPPAWPVDQYILRMMIRSPRTGGSYLVPTELQWLTKTIKLTDEIQRRNFPDQPFCYVTVRAGQVRSVTDDLWHVDGFSMRIPHGPEQNYIWSNCYSTEVLDQEFVIPDDFDPFKHNIHQFFQDRADLSKVRHLKEKHLALIDPYIVHRRRNTIPPGTFRVFFRISHVPIEIRDDACTPNPLLPPVVYGQKDFRHSLTRYPS